MTSVRILTDSVLYREINARGLGVTALTISVEPPQPLCVDQSRAGCEGQSWTRLVKYRLALFSQLNSGLLAGAFGTHSSPSHCVALRLPTFG